jgi:excisionase family DNA binding protein
MIDNPFEVIERRFNRLESLLVNLVKAQENPENQNCDSENYLSIKEAAKLLNLRVPTLYSEASLGTIPCNKQAGRLYFLKSELTKWIQEGRRLTQTEQTQATLDKLAKKRRVNNG